MSETTNCLISHPLKRYRECARSIWNIYLMDQYQATQNWDLLASYKRIKQELFDSIVLVPVLQDDEVFDYQLGFPCSRINVIPSQIPNPGNRWDMPVAINRIKGETAGYWDYPVTRITSQAELLFVDFFDWDAYGFIDMSIVVAEINAYPESPDLIGHRLLVKLMYVDSIFIAAASDGVGTVMQGSR
ncbi:hypothetical protein KFZ76_15550 [Methylovulum psychrotolerans]|uniref:hypothetical protein n=1 Tax=Methylovulum psychrotolerans TaxID=1704499 RepID=UPI001BFF6BEC|nr:hypothetical protein [Methylovulum psychrotolerans]MBT9099116.1 hypothetical protein [Methylovulum psychrotolerans]